MHESTKKLPVVFKEIWEPQKKLLMISHSADVVVENVCQDLQYFIIRG